MEKTTKNRSKMLLAGMVAVALTFGLILAGCSNSGGGGSVPQDGTYITADGNDKLVLSGSNWTEFWKSDTEEWIAILKGTLSVSGTTIAISCTQEYDLHDSKWNTASWTSPGTISSNGRTLTFASGSTYTKQ
ncbi:MAG: hypothetical protein Ta2A_26120 [Treponemataceae bacterium]|nr:MAG: hypothetical protein Ta2A_26120 [Treponemataceae bacterium]